LPTTGFRQYRRADSGSYFQDTLKTSLCALRLFPTADGPGNNYPNPLPTAQERPRLALFGDKRGIGEPITGQSTVGNS